MAGWEISCTWKIMEVHSWENHRTKWVVVQQAMVDCRRVYSFIAMILDKPYLSIPGSNHKRTTVMSGELPMVQLLHDSSGWKKTGFQAFQLTAGLIETDGRLGWVSCGMVWDTYENEGSIQSVENVSKRSITEGISRPMSTVKVVSYWGVLENDGELCNCG